MKEQMPIAEQIKHFEKMKSDFFGEYYDPSMTLMENGDALIERNMQIEEMANVIQHSFQMLLPHDMALVSAEYLRNEGYRKQEWISVADRLPEVRQRVLLYSYHDGINTGYRADEIGRFYVDKSYPYRPTYWMPLPEPPKMKGGAE